MKKTVAFSLSLLLIRFSLLGQELSEISTPPDGDNEKAEVSQWIGPVKVTIAYHSPRVHFKGAERTGHIWGELVQYGFFDDGFGPSKAMPWRAGANETTTIAFSHDVKVDGKAIKAGTYGLFLDVEKAGPWNWVFSSNAMGWGSYQYDSKNDVLRTPATPTDAPFTEFLTYGFDDRLPASAVAFLQWENKRVPFKIEVPNVNDIWVAKIRNDLQGWPGFNYQNWQNAAQFCADNKVNLEEALVWADKAITVPFRGAAIGRGNFSTLQTKAAVLTAMGRDSDAEATMEKALHLPGAEPIAIHQYAMRLLRGGKKEKAMEIFQFNFKQHPDEKFYTYVGLARGYTAMGDKEKAIKNWEIALQNVPESQKGNRPVYEKALQDLKAK